MSAIVPFGKYKGQPVERMIADRDYCEWLAGQDWFRSRYGQIHTLVINYGAEPDETPEHNRMQARFLDDGYCFAVAAAAYDKLGATEEEIYQEIVEKVAQGRDLDNRRAYREAEWSASSKMERQIDEKGFECRGWDVHFLVSYGKQIFRNNSYETYAGVSRLSVGVECKPSVGDDFPKVMRQIMARPRCGVNVLLIDSYSGSGVSFDQMRQMMCASNIRVVLSSDVAS